MVLAPRRRCNPKAAIQAVERGLATTQQIVQHASQRNRRVARLVTDALGAARR